MPSAWPSPPSRDPRVRMPRPRHTQTATPAFSHICLATLPPLLKDISWTCTPTPPPPTLAFAPYVSQVPLCNLVSTGASLTLLTLMAEGLFKAVYARPARLKPSDDELCPHCAGFGSVMCELCLSTGKIHVMGTNVKRQCPICEGAKRERCRRCAGSGKTGMKKKRAPTPAEEDDDDL